MDESKDLREGFGKIAVFIAAILAVVGAVVVIPAGGALLLAELSEPSARPHCAYRTNNRSCVRSATTTAGAVRGKASIRASAREFCEKFPEMCESFRPDTKRSKTEYDVSEYRGKRTISLRLRDGRLTSRPPRN